MSDLKQALERALVRHETPWNDDPTDTTAFYDKDELAPIHKAMLKVIEAAEVMIKQGANEFTIAKGEVALAKLRQTLDGKND